MRFKNFQNNFGALCGNTYLLIEGYSFAILDRHIKFFNIEGEKDSLPVLGFTRQFHLPIELYNLYPLLNIEVVVLIE